MTMITAEHRASLKTIPLSTHSVFENTIAAWVEAPGVASAD